MNYRLCRFVAAAFVLLATTGAFSRVHAQGLTGQISGTVTDSGGGVMPGATVTVTNTGTNLTRDAVTGPDGVFQFPDLLAGTYDIKVSMEGFKVYEQQGLKLGATERLALRAITLEVGQLSEQVTVQAEATLVQTTNAARSGLVDREKIDDIALKGRDFAGYLKLLPGVVDTTNREAPGWGSMGGLSINGRSGGFNFSYDGVTSKDTGSNSGNYSAPALDSIAEVRVQTSNFQAEYGRSSGATITVVTRSGSKDFRGSLAYYKRDDSLNGNEFSRRQQCGLGNTAQCDPPLYQFDNTAWTLGGPVLVPGTDFNKGRNKLFFFFSQDILLAHGSGQPESAPHADGARAPRRLLADLRRSGPAAQHPRSATGGRLQRNRRPWPGLLPGQHHSGEPDRSGHADDVQPVPAAERHRSDRRAGSTTTCSRRSRTGPATTRSCAWTGTSAEKTTFYSRVQWGYEAYAGGVTSLLGSRRRLAAAAEQVLDPELRPRQHAAAHVQLDDVLRADRRRQLVAPEHAGAQPGGEGRQRSHARAAGVPAVLPVGEPGQHPAERVASPAAACRARSRRSTTDNRWPFFGYNTLWNFSGNVTKIKGCAQHEGGPLRRAHARARRSARRSTTGRSASTSTARTRSTRTSATRTACSAPSRSTRSRTATRRRTACS